MKIKLPLIFLLIFSFVDAQVPSLHIPGNTYSSGALVLDANGDTYIAQKDVDITGTALTDTSYWKSLDNDAPTSGPSTSPPSDPPTKALPEGDPPPDTNTTVSESTFFGISCRAYIDDAPMVGGLTIKGTESKKVLIRAKGPSMASVLPGKRMLPNPKIKVQKLDESTGKYSTVLQTNDYGDHESAQEYASEATGNSKEPMVVTTLEPGIYSIKVQDQTSGETGNANLEIYEVVGDSSSSLFFGLSGRAYIDDAPMVGGLTIKGTASKKVLIRAKGPSMASVLPGKKMLPNPKIKVQKLDETTGKYSTVLQTNDYGDHESAQEYASEATGNSNEPMVVTTLEPGIYSIKVQDQTSGETGNTNLEIYDFD